MRRAKPWMKIRRKTRIASAVSAIYFAGFALTPANTVDLLIDDHIPAVGTHNFDIRSFRLNFEVTSIIVDEGFPGEI